VAERTRKTKTVDKPTQSAATKKPAKAKPAAAPSSNKAPAKARPVRKPTPQKETAKPVQKLTTFEIEAPGAQEVCVVGCFNDWDPTANPLKRTQSGTWRGTVSIEPGEHQYRFVVDGEWRDDPVNTLRCWNEYGTENCILIIRE
jgi:hypothetical protein